MTFLRFASFALPARVLATSALACALAILGGGGCSSPALAPLGDAAADGATTAGCAAGATCAYVTAVCVRAPCGPTAACVKNNPCDSARCGAGTVCEVTASGAPSCVAASPRCGGIGPNPCRGKATCTPDPLDTCRSSTPNPDQDGICICDVDAATAGCSANERFDAAAGVCACVAR